MSLETMNQSEIDPTTNPEADAYKSMLAKDQIEMGIKVKRFAPMVWINTKLNNIENRLEVMPFWKNFPFVFMLLSSIIVPAFVVVAMIINFDKLQLDIPLFFDPTQNSWDHSDKSLVVLVPIGYGIINLILLNITNSIFKFDRRLAKMISVAVSVANILLLIAFAQILSMLLI